MPAKRPSVNQARCCNCGRFVYSGQDECDSCSGGYGPPWDFMPGEDGYARERAWEAGERG